MIIKEFQSIRYMGNKTKLLKSILPIIKREMKQGDVFCDLMAGTGSVGFSLSSENKIIANDVQTYSYFILNAILKKNKKINVNEIINIIMKEIEINNKNKFYTFFYERYSETYFSKFQCIEIDNIRYAIDQLKDEYEQTVCMVSLMHSMTRLQSTSGHFAQYLTNENKRLGNLKKRKILEVFLEKIKEFEDIEISKYDNEVYNYDVDVLLNEKIDINKIDVFYLDPPYTGDQYSRFYHLLETVVKYDNPDLSFKGLYREKRFKSDFCYKTKCEGAFRRIAEQISRYNKKMIISYINNGVLEKDKLINMLKKFFKIVEINEFDFEHSKQGRGKIKTKEILIICK